MEKYKYDKKNGLWYELQGDYFLPCLTLPPGTNDRPIGVWAQAHKRYLLNYHKIRYTNLLTSCKLHSYLADIEERAQAMYESIIYETAKREGVTEHLKANDMMAWVTAPLWYPYAYLLFRYNIIPQKTEKSRLFLYLFSRYL